MMKSLTTLLLALTFASAAWATELETDSFNKTDAQTESVQDVYSFDEEVPMSEEEAIMMNDGAVNPEYRPPRRPNRMWTCQARNVRRQAFYGRGYNRNQAQNMAIRQCRRYSAVCWVSSCWR